MLKVNLSARLLGEGSGVFNTDGRDFFPDNEVGGSLQSDGTRGLQVIKVEV